MTTQQCLLYCIFITMAISYLATAALGSGQFLPQANHSKHHSAKNLHKKSLERQSLLDLNCQENSDCRVSFLGTCLTYKKPSQRKSCQSNNRYRRLLLQQGDGQWDQMAFDCTTECTDSGDCQQCSDEIANACGDYFSSAKEEWFVSEVDPEGQWTAMCATVVEIANPELGTECAVCFYDLAH